MRGSIRSECSNLVNWHGQRTEDAGSHAEIADALQAESRAASNAERLVTVKRLAALYTELQSHKRIAKSELLQRKRRRILLRLVSIFEEVTSAVVPRVVAKGSDPSMKTSDRHVAAIVPGDLALLQAVGGGVQAAAGGVGPVAATGMSGRSDYREQLIDVITRTIVPDTWETVGGPSSIVYYEQGLALVVRAPQAIHDKMANLMANLCSWTVIESNAIVE